jgi:hypothetical protein
VRALPLAADVTQTTVGEGERADRDDDQHPVHDHLVAEHPLEKPMTVHFLRLENVNYGARKAGLASRIVDLRGTISPARRPIASVQAPARPSSDGSPPLFLRCL